MTKRKNMHIARRPGEPAPEFTKEQTEQWLARKAQRKERQRLDLSETQASTLRTVARHIHTVADELDVSGEHCGECARYQPINIGQHLAYQKLNSMQEIIHKMIVESGHEPRFITTEGQRQIQQKTQESYGPDDKAPARNIGVHLGDRPFSKTYQKKAEESITKQLKELRRIRIW